MSDHEHDEEGDCIIVTQPPEEPNWIFSGWDVAGIGAAWFGGLFSVTGQALNLLARECNAMANYRRDVFAEKLERARADEDLQILFKGES